MMKKKLFISDLDGTLLNNSAEISEYTKQTINALTDKGVCFTVASARTIATVASILDGTRLNVPAVLMNGVCIYDTEEKNYINCHYIDGESFDNFVSLVASDRQISPFIYTIKDSELTAYYQNLESANARAFADERREKYGKRFVKVSSFEQLDKSYAVYFTISERLHLLIPYYEKLRQDPKLYVTLYHDTYNPDMYYLESCRSAASKAGGVKFLREKYSFDEIYCFGDNTNDLPMFYCSDHRYAMLNAANEVMACADEVIDSNENDGVARKLLEIIGGTK